MLPATILLRRFRDRRRKAERPLRRPREGLGARALALEARHIRP
jgi:hypothetical protein